MLALASRPMTTAADDDPFRPQAEPASPYPLRTWADATGKHKIEARFVSATADQVSLQSRAGDTVQVPRARLGERERGYIEGIEADASVASKLRPSAPPPAAQPKVDTPPKDAADVVADAGGREPVKPSAGEAREIELPDLVGDVSPAAAGRLLLLHLPKTKQVAVYDVNEAKIVKFISLSSDSATIIGGMTKMIVVLPNEKLIERWSLETFKKETTRPLPIDGVFKAMAMGYAVDGPLMMHWAASTDALARCQYALFETDNFKQLDYTIRGRNSSYRDAVHIRASATGDVFGLWASSHSPQGMEVMRIVGDKVVNSYQHSSAGHLAPNFDGSAVLTGYAGVCTAQLNRKQERNAKRVPLVPSTHPKFFLSVPAEPGAQINLGSKAFEGVKPSLYTLGRETQLVNAPDLKLGATKDNASWSRGDFSLDKRVHYVVAANQIISIPFTNDKLIVQPFDCRAEMEKADIDYLFVLSVPQRTVRQGEDFRYPIEVATNAGAPKFEVNSGPEGMAVDDEGLVRWKVPMNFSDEKVNVIITIRRRTGKAFMRRSNSRARRPRRMTTTSATHSAPRPSGRGPPSPKPARRRRPLMPPRRPRLPKRSPAGRRTTGWRFTSSPRGFFARRCPTRSSAAAGPSFASRSPSASGPVRPGPSCGFTTAARRRSTS